jgi:plastocyanin
MNNNRNLIVATSVAVVILLVGASIFFLATKTDDHAHTSNESNSSSNSNGVVSTNTVSIENSSFSPANIKVKKGTQVTWTNKDSLQHNVFSSDGGPQGTLLSRGESFTFTFDKVGTFTYICQPHPFMKGSVTVTE